jgi:hypothetical protein
MKKSPRQLQREAQKRKQTQQKVLLSGGIGLAVVAVIIVIYLVATKSPSSGGLMGEEVAIPSRDHVSADTVPGPFNSNPPAGGAHFDTDYPAHFYQESELASLPAHPEGYLVHSLEHGYVIFWYNCQIPNTDCAALKQTIQQVMNDTGNTKLIAFPWSSMDTSLAMTSWGRILKFTRPDPAQMKQFVLSNRYKAPEPDAP